MRALRQRGIDTLNVAELDRGITDAEVLQLSVDEKRPLPTEDRDFGELAYRQRREAYGVVLLRIPTGDDSQWPSLGDFLLDYAEKLKNSYVVVQSNSVRIRQLP